MFERKIDDAALAAFENKIGKLGVTLIRDRKAIPFLAFLYKSKRLDHTFIPFGEHAGTAEDFYAGLFVHVQQGIEKIESGAS